MTKNSGENQTCQACGADVRLNALFCYNCGSQVASDEEVAAENKNGSKVSSAWFKDSIAEVKLAEKPKSTTQTTKTAPKTKNRLDTVDASMAADKTADDASGATEGLRTAAAIRKRPNPLLKKKVEVTWEAYDNAPNVWFLVVSVVLAVIAGLLLLAMLYIR